MASLGILFVISLVHFEFAHLVSSSPPKLMPLNGNIDLVQNMTFVLPCSLISGSNTFFEWTHNGVKLLNSSSVRIENSPTFSQLTFQSANSQQHDGHYECRVTNLLGQFDVTKTKIRVQGNIFFAYSSL